VSDSHKAAGASFVLAVVGIASNGPGGLSFLMQPVPTPLWFILSAVAMPTGEMLKMGRQAITARLPQPKA